MAENVLVLVVGAGPAGAVAATVLARAGVRVRLVDRATFPREKLCGDTLNPGSMALLRRLNMAHAVETRGVRVDGMIVTGEGGVSIEGRYPRNLSGRALTRSVLDWALVQEAVSAGADFEPGIAVRRACVTEVGGRPRVDGVVLGAPAAGLRAFATIAADGRRSTLAFGLGLVRHPVRPRRWAIGAYFDRVARAEGSSSLGEMHIRRGRYIGVAPVTDDLTNVCLVRPYRAGDGAFGDPEALLRGEIERDPLLADRFRRARLVRPPAMLGPLAVDAGDTSIDGLLLAGDASGFVDPMTGDGLRFAIRGGELAALAVLRALEHGWSGIHRWLRDARRREFAAKWRFNRALRAIVASPLAVRSAAVAARITPAVVRTMVAHAGDCNLVEPGST